MTIDQLEMLEAIVNTGSMQQAAKKIHKSQPSLSVGIKKIEELYGIQIFSREKYRPSLTEQGKVFYRNALQVLESHRKLHKIATELAEDVEAEIKIVIDPIVLLSRVQKLLEKATSFSDVTQIILMEDVLQGPIGSLINQEVQFAIGHCPPHLANQVIKKQIGQIDLVPVIKKGLDYKKLPNIVVSSSKETPDIQTLNTASWFVSRHSRKEELILNGLGWGRMSKLKIKKLKEQLSIIKSSDSPSVQLDVYLMINRQCPLGRIGQVLWDSI